MNLRPTGKNVFARRLKQESTSSGILLGGEIKDRAIIVAAAPNLDVKAGDTVVFGGKPKVVSVDGESLLAMKESDIYLVIE